MSKRWMRVTAVLWLSLVLPQPAFATGTPLRGAMYIGVNGTRHAWHVKQRLSFNNSISNPSTFFGVYGKTRDQYTGDLLLGFTGWIGPVFSAIEGWYNACPFTARQTIDSNIVFATRMGKRYGARLRLGVENQRVYLFGILGLTQLPLKTTTTFPSGSIYRGSTVTLASNRFSKTVTSRVVGVGMSTTFDNHLNLGYEYLHQRGSMHTNLMNTLNNSTAGLQTTKVTSDTIKVSLHYQFPSLVF